MDIMRVNDQGAMADTADLIVLGAYYGTGSKGILIIRLIGEE